MSSTPDDQDYGCLAMLLMAAAGWAVIGAVFYGMWVIVL